MLRLDILLKVSHNDWIRWLTLSFNEPSIFNWGASSRWSFHPNYYIQILWYLIFDLYRFPEFSIIMDFYDYDGSIQIRVGCILGLAAKSRVVSVWISLWSYSLRPDDRIIYALKIVYFTPKLSFNLGHKARNFSFLYEDRSNQRPVIFSKWSFTFRHWSYIFSQDRLL